MIVAGATTVSAVDRDVRDLLRAEAMHLRSALPRRSPPFQAVSVEGARATPGIVGRRWRAILETHAGWTARPAFNLPPHPSHLEAKAPSFDGGLSRGPAVMTIALGKSENILFRTLAAWHFQRVRDGVTFGVLLTPTTRTARSVRGNVHPYGTYLAMLTMLELTGVDSLPMVLIAVAHDPNDPEINPDEGARPDREVPP